MKTKTWYAHGKLLLTGEYFVLKGAKALAVPLKLGQYLTITERKEKLVFWNAMKPDGFWFQAACTLPDLKVIQTTDHELCNRLRSIVTDVRKLNPNFLKGETGFSVETILEFDPNYGFGSSSTLIANLAKWAGVDPFKLQKLSFGGSGYDIANATLKDPIIYQLIDETPKFEHVNINFDFLDQIYFVYLGKKQSSAESIVDFNTKSRFSKKDIVHISRITNDILNCKTLIDFETLLTEHEVLMSRVLKRKRVQSLLFPDHKGVVKSLGGWGGDFVLMTSKMKLKEFENYITRLGFDTFYRYDQIVL